MSEMSLVKMSWNVLNVLAQMILKNRNKSNNVYFRYACVLAFDVKVLPEAQYFADNNKIKIFQAKIIYHLFDRFKEHV